MKLPRLVERLIGMNKAVTSTITLVVLLAACASNGDAYTTTTSTSTSTSTSASTTTTTSAPTSTTTLPPAADTLFVVTGVGSDDVLNVRQGPNASAAIVATLAPGDPVRTTGLATPDVPNAGWWQVSLENGSTGWANRRFIGIGPAYATPIADLGCGHAGSDTRSPAVESSADHILALTFEGGAECDRLVILLGSGAAGGDWPESPADEVPAGITVTAEGTVAVVSFPGEASGGQTGLVRPSATEADFGEAQAFVVRQPAPSPATRGGAEVRAHFFHNITVAAAFVPNPARIIVDVYPAPTGTGLDYTPRTGGLTVLEQPIQVDLNGPGVALPVEVSGYARPFEAQGVAQLRTPDEQPGGGRLVAATFSGSAGTVSDSTYPYMTTDWTEMWGRFSFTIDDLEPGTYELFVGEFSARDGSPVGVYDEFTVLG